MLRLICASLRLLVASAFTENVADLDRVTSLPGLTQELPGVHFAGYASAKHTAAGVDLETAEADGPELFYWFAGASGADPAAKPTVLWTNGGPGASSFWGFFLENGPLEIADAGGLGRDPVLALRQHAWSDFANFLIFEHPLGVTLSVADSDTDLPNNVTIGIDHLYSALLHFAAKHPEIARSPLILAGESYAGTYLPLLAQKILEGNARASAPGAPGWLDLRTLVLLDAWVNPALQMPSGTAYAFSHGLITATQKRELDERYAGDDLPFINEAIANLTGVYMANIAERGDPSPQPVVDYLNRDDVRESIHAKKGTPLASLFSEAIADLYADGVNDSYQSIVQALLDAGLPTLVISGLNDAKDCNFLGTGDWLSSLDGQVAQRFHSANSVPWASTSDPKLAVLGFMQDGGVDGLAWLKVLNAGHLAALDQPLLIDFILERVGFAVSTPVIVLEL